MQRLISEDLGLDMNAVLEDLDYGYIMEIDLDFPSNRQRKKFLRNPEFYLVSKMRSTEVRWSQLGAKEKKAFPSRED